MNKIRTESRQCSLLPFISVVLIPLILAGCGSCKRHLDLIDYSPLSGGDWNVSTPKEQGLDPDLLNKLYFDAAKLETLYSLLVVKNGKLIAERYFNEGSIDQVSGRQSVTKSFTSALVGIAIDQDIIASVDQKMMDFFPEYADQITDPRKEQITIRHLLQMRAGYPNEENMTQYQDILFFSDNWHWLPHIEGFPLVHDPDSGFQYSNLMSHLLGVIVARACGTELKSYAQEHLFSPINAVVGDWTADADGYNWGWGDIYVTARDMAKFGLLYLNGGEYNGQQVISNHWVRDSLQRYTENIKIGGWSKSRYGDFYDIGYGFQWWSARVGDHLFDYASGHGAQYIILLHDLNMIIVTTADPLYGPELAGAGGWKYEGAINKAVAKFIKSLPSM
jgi:CubicO group peptidase (beta-lactamase class C family)